jgi:hypothetical protein
MATKFEALSEDRLQVADETVNNSSAMQNDNELSSPSPRRRSTAPVPDHLQLQLDRGHEVQFTYPVGLTATYSLLCVGRAGDLGVCMSSTRPASGSSKGPCADRSIHSTAPSPGWDRPDAAMRAETPRN